MQIGPWTIGRTTDLQLQQKQIPLQPLSGRGGWWPLSIREPYTGAWQQNQEISQDTALSYFAVFACTTLIASDVAKLKLRVGECADNMP